MYFYSVIFQNRKATQYKRYPVTVSKHGRLCYLHPEMGEIGLYLANERVVLGEQHVWVQTIQDQQLTRPKAVALMRTLARTRGCSEENVLRFFANRTDAPKAHKKLADKHADQNIKLILKHVGKP